MKSKNSGGNPNDASLITNYNGGLCEKGIKLDSDNDLILDNELHEEINTTQIIQTDNKQSDFCDKIFKDNTHIRQKIRRDNSNSYLENPETLSVPIQLWSEIYDPQANIFDSFKYTTIFSELLASKTGCLINIKGHDINKTHITIRAYCGHSNTKLNKRCRLYKLSNKNLSPNQFKIYFSNSDICHPYKRAGTVSKYKRIQYKKLLFNKTVEKAAEDLFQNEDKDFVAKHNTMLVSKSHDVLRKIKSEAVQDQDNDCDDIKDIFKELLIQNNSQDQYIQRLSYYPFHVISYSKIQCDMIKYAKIQSKERELVAFMDATGGLIRPPNKHSPTIYYYAIVIHVSINTSEPTDLFPVTDFVSASHNFESIRIWLQSFRLFAERLLGIWPIFNAIVTDFSFAQINAALESFNNINIVEYLKYCYTVILSNTGCVKYTKIYLCCSHIMKNMTTDVNFSFAITSIANKYVKELISSLFIIQSDKE